MIEPTIARMNDIPLERAVDAEGRPTAELDAVLSAAKRNALLEMLGFIVVFTCMILMRFGL